MCFWSMMHIFQVLLHKRKHTGEGRKGERGEEEGREKRREQKERKYVVFLDAGI